MSKQTLSILACLLAGCGVAPTGDDSEGFGSTCTITTVGSCAPKPSPLPPADNAYVDNITGTTATIHFRTVHGAPDAYVLVNGVKGMDGAVYSHAVVFQGLKPGVNYSYAIYVSGAQVLWGEFKTTPTPPHPLPIPYPLPGFTSGMWTFAIDGEIGGLWVAHQKPDGSWEKFDRYSGQTGLRDVAAETISNVMHVGIVDAAGHMQVTQYGGPPQFVDISPPGPRAPKFTRCAMASYIDHNRWNSGGWLAFAVSTDGGLYSALKLTDNLHAYPFGADMRTTLKNAPPWFSSVAAATDPYSGDILVAAVGGGDIYLTKTTPGSGSWDDFVDLAQKTGDTAAFYEVAVVKMEPPGGFAILALSTDGVHYFWGTGPSDMDRWGGTNNIAAFRSPAPVGLDLRIASTGTARLGEIRTLFVPLADHQPWYDDHGVAAPLSLAPILGDLSPVRGMAVAMVDGSTVFGAPMPPAPPKPTPPAPQPATCPVGESWTYYQFCQTCHSAVGAGDYPPSTITQLACDKDSARAIVEYQHGGDCELDDDPCPCNPLTMSCGGG